LNEKALNGLLRKGFMFIPHFLFGLLTVYLLSMPFVFALIAAYLPDFVDKFLMLFGLTGGRSFPHSWLILAPFVLWLALDRKNKLALIFVIGIAGHLAIDLLDEPGIPLFYPFGGYVGTHLFEGTTFHVGNILAGSGPWVQTSEKVWAAEALSLVACVPVGYLILRKRKNKG
jgi:membrane-bound metal-dependent hydrolase YbcI (DUF457 family)